MTQTDKLVACANCSRPVREDDAERLGWRRLSDGCELRLICALCARRTFHPDAPERFRSAAS